MSLSNHQVVGNIRMSLLKIKSPPVHSEPVPMNRVKSRTSGHWLLPWEALPKLSLVATALHGLLGMSGQNWHAESSSTNQLNLEGVDGR